MTKEAAPRKISRQTFEHLSDLEKLVGNQFVLEGRWQIVEGEK